MMFILGWRAGWTDWCFIVVVELAVIADGCFIVGVGYFVIANGYFVIVYALAAGWTIIG